VKRRLKWRASICGGCIALGWATHGVAGDSDRTVGSQAYPVRPVRVIVPFAPGGSDVPARMLAQKLSEKLGQPFVVDNRPGASGVLGAAITAQATPDGYTLLFCTASHPVIAVYYRKLPFDPVRNFAPVTFVGSVPFALVTHPSLPVSSLKEFVAYAKARRGQLNYGSPGIGGIGHLAHALLAKQTGIEVTHVPFKGTGPALAALTAGEIQFMLANLVGVLPHAKAGKLKMLGVASIKRAQSASDVPTFAEAGVKGAEAGTWYGVLAPRGTPQATVELLNREIGAQLQTPSLREQFAGIGVIPEPGSAEQFASFIRAEIDKWGGVMKYSGIKQEVY
jgi:tripartite-type tricarboxylate transporter receptor subunit TctC